MPKFLDQVLSDMRLFDLLLEFLNQDEPLPVLAGYFSKACESLLGLNVERFLLEFFRRDGHLKLVRGIGNLGLAELLGRILMKSCEFGEFFEEFSAVFVEIAGKIREFDQISCFNVVCMVKQITDRSNFQIPGFMFKYLDKNSSFVDLPSSVFKAFLKANPEFLEKILDALSSSKSFTREASLRILLVTFQCINHEIDLDVQWGVSILLKAIKDLLKVLGNPAMSQEHLITLEILKTCLAYNSQEISKILKNSQILSALLANLLNHPFCNFLHNSFLSIFTSILNSQDSVLKLHILEDLNLATFIMNQSLSPKVHSKNCEIRKGYIPHLLALSNLLQTLKKTDFFLKEHLSSLKSWKSFTREVLEAQNLLESRQLGGENFENFFEKSSYGDENFEVEDDFSDVNYWKLPIKFVHEPEDL